MAVTTARQWLCTTAAGIACGWLGWTAGQSATPPSPVARVELPSPSATPAATALADGEPTVVVAPDGRVTLHVVGRPLTWVLAELDRQSAAAGGAQTARPADAGAARTASTAAAVGARPAEVADRVMRGSEAERYDGLLEAQNSGAVSESMLRTLYETDASPRVRLLAFSYSLEGTEADPAARRSALEAARLLPDAAIAQEAARLLEAMPRDEPGRSDAQQSAARR